MKRYADGTTPRAKLDGKVIEVGDAFTMEFDVGFQAQEVMAKLLQQPKLKQEFRELNLLLDQAEDEGEAAIIALAGLALKVPRQVNGAPCSATRNSCT